MIVLDGGGGDRWCPEPTVPSRPASRSRLLADLSAQPRGHRRRLRNRPVGGCRGARPPGRGTRVSPSSGPHGLAMFLPWQRLGVLIAMGMAVGQWGDPGSAPGFAVAATTQVAAVATGLLLLAGEVDSWRVRRRLRQFAVRLASASGEGGVSLALASALGDTSVDVRYWAQARRGFRRPRRPLRADAGSRPVGGRGHARRSSVGRHQSLAPDRTRPAVRGARARGAARPGERPAHGILARRAGRPRGVPEPPPRADARGATAAGAQPA